MRVIRSLGLSVLSLVLSSAAWGASSSYSCVNLRNEQDLRSLTIEDRWLLQDHILWTSREGYAIEFPRKTVSAEGLDFGFTGHSFEVTRLTSLIPMVNVDQSLFVDARILKNEESGVVIESYTFGADPETMTTQTAAFDCQLASDSRD